jgi:hypothetical protein
VALGETNGKVKIFSLAEDRVIQTLETGKTGTVAGVVFSSDGSTLVASDEFGYRHEWKLPVKNAVQATPQLKQAPIDMEELKKTQPDQIPTPRKSPLRGTFTASVISADEDIIVDAFKSDSTNPSEIRV